MQIGFGEMQSFLGSIRLVRRQAINSPSIAESARSFHKNCGLILGSLKPHTSVSNERTKSGTRTDLPTSSYNCHMPLLPLLQRGCNKPALISTFPGVSRCITTQVDSSEFVAQNSSASVSNDAPPRIKFKRLDKTARHIMQILDREAVEDVRRQREIPDIQPGYIIQLKVEVPENKRRVSILKGIVIARRNAGINTTFRLRRLVAGVGVESLFPLYSPNIKEIKVLDKKKVRRAKLYYLRDKMNALKKH